MKKRISFNQEILTSLRKEEPSLQIRRSKVMDHVKLHQRHTKAGVVWVQLCKVCQQELKVFEQGRKLYGFYN